MTIDLQEGDVCLFYSNVFNKDLPESATEEVEVTRIEPNRMEIHRNSAYLSRLEKDWVFAPEYFKPEWIAMVLYNKYEENSKGVEKKVDAVHSPSHYALFEDTEAIEVIARSLTKEEFRGYCMGNLLKYRLRCGKKDDVSQELNKADKYKELYEKYKGFCYER